MSKIYLSVIGVFLCTSLTTAQPTQTVTDSLQLDRIVITASKIPLSQRETTKPVLIIEREQIERSSGRDLSQILNQQSGIRVNDSYGAPSNGRILYMQGAAAQNTLILVDGLPISDPSGVGGLFDLRLLPTNNVERIEVIKGSQSTLYGTDAIAGVVNLITRSGSDRPLSGNGNLSYGSYNSLNTSAGINGSAGSSVRYTLNYNRESSDGFSAAANPGDNGNFGDDGYLMSSLYGKVDLTVVTNLTISPYLNFTTYEGDFDGGAFQDAENEFTLEMFNPGIQAEYRAENLRVNGGYNYTRTDRSFLSQFGENEFEGQFHNADLFGNYSISQSVRFLAGLNFQDFSIPGSTEIEDSRDTQIVSPYATIYLKDLNGFSAELGYRLNNHSEYGNNSTFSFAPAYNITDRIKLFGSVTTGFKAPTLDELFGPFGANAELDPQKSLYMNIGAEAYLLEQSLKLSAQYFTRKIDDLIVFTFDPGYINRDRQDDSGLEFSADWIINNRITAGVWYNYIEGKITTLDAQGDEARIDNLIRRPSNSFGLNAGVSVTEQFFVRIDGEYNGERSDLFFNPDNSFAQEDVILDAYTLLNLYAEYRMLDKKLTIFGDVKNLFNTDFTEVYGFNTTGFAIKTGLRFNF
jgi:vitamin B12 transporter